MALSPESTASSQLTIEHAFAIVSNRLDDHLRLECSIDAPQAEGGNLSENSFLFHSLQLAPQEAGELLDLPRQQAHWDWMSFFVRRLQPGDVFRAVVGEGLRYALLGVAIGIAAGLVLTRLLASFLYGISAYDPATFLAVAILLTTVSAAASYFPARRATRVDPIIALRYE